jgi:outer membrane protein assembly factor BamB
MKRLFFLLTFILFLIAAGCSNKEPVPRASLQYATEAAVSAEELSPVEPPALDEGIIAFITGEVDIADESGWFPAEIGDFVSPSDKIRTAADSSCEIQFASIAVIKLQENTEVDISRISLAPESSKVGIALAAGTVLSKVQKLSGTDSFSVRTQSAVCGVRGTEFSVTTDAAGHSVFAVKEGSVAILPPSLDPEDLKEKMAGKDVEAEKYIDQLLETAPRIEANQEMAVSPAFAGETREAAESITRNVEEIAAAGSREELNAKTRTLAAATEQSAQTIRQQSSAPVAISPEKAEVLKQTEKMTIREIPVAAAKGTGAEPPQISLHKVALKVSPQDTHILLNGETAGRGSYAGLFKEGSSLSFILRRDGYKDHQLSVSVSSGAAKLYTIEMAALPPDVPAEPVSSPEPVTAPEPKSGPSEAPDDPSAVQQRASLTEAQKKPPAPAAETPAPAAAEAAVVPPAPAARPQSAARVEPETQPESAPEPQMETTGNTEAPPAPEEPRDVHLTISVFPGDAAIQIDNGPISRGRASIEAIPGTMLSVTVSRRGFAGEKITLKMEDRPISRHVVLSEQPVLFSSSASTEAAVGLAASDKRLIVSDSKGRLTALNLDGNVLWRLESSNSPNENSIPVIIDTRLLFSGSRELVIADIRRGEELQRIRLDSSRSHLFGRRAAAYGGRILYPSNSALEYLDPDSGSFSPFADLGNTVSRTTPAVYLDTVLIADQYGTLLGFDSRGTVVQEIPTNAVQPLALAVSVHKDRAVFSGRRGVVVCVNLENDSVLWEQKLGNTGVNVTSDITVSDSGLFVYGRDGTIYGLDWDNGEALFTPIRGAATPPSVIGGGQFVYGTRDRKLVIAEADSGATIKSLTIGEQLSARPVLIPGDSLIAVGTRQGTVMLIEPEGMR